MEEMASQVPVPQPEEPQDMLSQCLRKQMSELEVFQAMYPPRNIIITNIETLEDIKYYVANKSNYIPSHLDYTLKIDVDKFKLELSVHIPSFYPIELPELYVRCNQLSRQEEKNLNTEMTEYLQNKFDGEVCIYRAILWLIDNIEKHKDKIPSTNTAAKHSNVINKFTRFWIFSHHISAKKKREDIIKSAVEYKLTGFCLIGKPGIICVEGPEEVCYEFWKIVKSLAWQKIALRKVEAFDRKGWEHQQRFTCFKEISFQNPVTHHTCMSSFHKFLNEHNLSIAFKEFFGVSHD